jgi:hypothetical protein
MNPLDTRASAGYNLHGIALHETLHGQRRHLRHEPAYYGGMTLLARALLTCAGAAGTVWAVEMASRVWMF